MTSFLLALSACEVEETETAPEYKFEPQEEPATTTTIQVDACKAKPFTVATRNQGSFSLPKTGKMVEESHYVTNVDWKGRYPANGREFVAEHLERSCLVLKQRKLFPIDGDCGVIYRNSWQKVWTPSENGNIGQGSLGKVFPKLHEEMWQGNMYFKKNVPRGTRFLAQANGRSVVLYMGHELGPSSRKFIGGMAVEAHWYLKTNNSSTIKVSYLDNQKIPFGPIKCIN